MPDKELFMQKAISIAKKGIYTCSPNPMVGCVIVNNDKIISEGYHEFTGRNHAEINAIKNIKGKLPKNSEMYVTLEPCSHTGKTGACTDTIIKSGIKKVYIGMLDPNPLVNGKGIKLLNKFGIKTEVGLCSEDIKKMNLGYMKRITKKLPYIILKHAISADNKIAYSDYKSKWISNSKSRDDVQYIRASSCAILTTARTVMYDNPRLNVRKTKKELGIKANFKQPVQIILDNSLMLDIKKYKIFMSKNKKIVFNSKISKDNGKQNIDYIKIPLKDNRLELRKIMKILAEDYKINILLIEAGGILFSNLLKQQLFDEIIYYKSSNNIGNDGIDSISNNFFENKYNPNVRLDNVRFFDDNIKLNYMKSEWNVYWYYKRNGSSKRDKL